MRAVMLMLGMIEGLLRAHAGEAPAIVIQVGPACR